MLTSPFESDQRSYLVLRNDKGQYSLWSDFAEPPAGWQATASSLPPPGGDDWPC